MKKLLFFLCCFFAARAAHAQANNARMLTGVNTVTATTYTFLSTDATKVTAFNSASPVAATLANGATVGFGAGTIFSVANIGAGPVTITCSSCTISGASTLVLAQNQGADIYGGAGSPGVNYIALSSPSGTNFPLLNGSNAFTGNNTHSGTETFSGSSTLTNPCAIDGLIYVSSGGCYTTISAAVAALPTINSKPAGQVYITNPVTMANGQEVTFGPYTQLIFGPNATVTYSGTGTAFTCSDAPTTYGGDGGIYNLVLNVTNNAGSGIQNNECTWFDFNQVWIQGPGSSSTGIPILFSNTQKWTEQSNLTLVHVQNFVNGITFQDNCAAHTGCPSFAYSRWRHVVVSPVGTGNYGFQFQNDTNWNGSDIDIQCFGGLTAITCLSLTGTSSINLIRLKIGGETGGPASTGISTAVGTTFAPIGLWERWNAGTWTDSFSGTYIPYIYNTPGNLSLSASASALQLIPSGSSFSGQFSLPSVTGFRTYTLPDISGTVAFNTQNAVLQQQQVIANQGSSCTNGELALSGGWQSTGSATVTAVSGTGQTCSWTITTGTTTGANPTVTDTLTNALPAATTVCEMNIHGGTHTPAAGEGFQQTTLSATAPIFTFNGTPTAGGTTYFVTRRCGP